MAQAPRESGFCYAQLLQQLWQEFPSANRAQSALSDSLPNYQTVLQLLAFCSIQEGKDSAKKLSYEQRLQEYRSLDSRTAKLFGSWSEKQVPEQAFRSLLAELMTGVPLPYLLGFEDFGNYTFATGPGALVPREDSEVLLNMGQEFCEEFFKDLVKASSPPEFCVLELCCGTACISLSLYMNCIGKYPSLKCWASDISAEALSYAEQNRRYWLEVSKTAGVGRAEGFRLCQSDLLQNCDLQRKYDLILANPPYLSTREYQRRSTWCEPLLALEAGTDGFSVLERIVEDAPNYLAAGGSLILEAAPWQIHQLQNMLEERGAEQVQRRCDSSGLERTIRARFWL